MVNRIIVLSLLIIGVVGLLQSASAHVEPHITDYYSVCKFGTQGTVSTWHGVNRDGKPPYDPHRRTFNFLCEDKQIYAPAPGVVYGYTPKYGGAILAFDSENAACMVFLGMHTFEVELGQELETGTFLGTYGHMFHFVAVDGGCEEVNFYDIEARKRERPIVFIDIGYELAPDIRKAAPAEFLSQNPGGAPTWSANTIFQVLDSLDGWVY